MARPVEFLEEEINEAKLELVEIRGILYGDKKRNETAGIVQAVGQMARMGEERDRRLVRMETLLEQNAEAVSRLEVRLEPVALRAEDQRRNAASVTLGNIALILWVIIGTLPVLISDFRSTLFPDEPWLWLGVLVLAAGGFTALALTTRKSGNGR
jgi:hypothetical protein